MRTMFLVGLAVMAQTVANTLLSKGMKVIAATPSFSSDFSPLLLISALQSPFIWGGIVLLSIYFVCFLWALSRADLSLVLPVTALGYILDVLTGHYFLGEPVPPARWFGAAIIVLGVLLVSRSASRNTARTDEGGVRQRIAC